MEWNVYGKIKSISKDTNGDGIVDEIITYTYDVVGNQISKTVGNEMTYYIRDGSGNVMSVYTLSQCIACAGGGGNEPLKQMEVHLYGSSRLGILKRDVDMDSPADLRNYTSQRGNKRYEGSNHLGNTLVVFTDRKLNIDRNGDGMVDNYEVEIANASDYYPFGMQMPGRVHRSLCEGGYRYGFNGKENDNEVKGEGGQQDYGMRIYDPRVGRFLSVDPLAVKYPWLTPYQFSSNTPIKTVDLDGLEASWQPPAQTPLNKNQQSTSESTCIGCAERSQHADQIKNPYKSPQRNIANLSIVQGHPQTQYEKEVNKEFENKENVAKALNGATMDNLSGQILVPTAVGTSEVVKSSIQHGLNIVEGIKEKDGWKIAKNTALLGLDAMVFVMPSEAPFLYSEVDGLWLGAKGSVGFGADAATMKSLSNLTPKRGWFDVVVHGDSFYEGSAFNINGNTVSATDVYGLMLQNGYKQGTRIRLISCNAGKGAAQELSNLAHAQVIAPNSLTKVAEGGKLITQDGSKYQVFNPVTQ